MSQVTLVSSHGPITKEKWQQALTHAEEYLNSSALSLVDAMGHLFSENTPESDRELIKNSTSCLTTLMDTVISQDVVLTKFPIPKPPSISRDMAVSQSLLHIRRMSSRFFFSKIMTYATLR